MINTRKIKIIIVKYVLLKILNFSSKIKVYLALKILCSNC